MPELSEPWVTLSNIYEEIDDLKNCLKCSGIAAFLIKTDVERWVRCAELAKTLKMHHNALYCLNRAIK